jgi:hypothetical protein
MPIRRLRLVERLEQVDRAHLAERHLGAHQVLALDRAAVLRARGLGQSRTYVHTFGSTLRSSRR